MIAKAFPAQRGTIRYWTDRGGAERPQLVFLPGLTADHRLFEKQLEYFAGRYTLFVWDAPGHGLSWPYEPDFSLEDKARRLKEILDEEGFDAPVIVGQSMGGYLGQVFCRLFPDRLSGFISIDSAPLGRSYYRAWELGVLKRMEPVYRCYPWKLLLKQGSEGVAESVYGRALMREIMMTYDGDKKRYAALAGGGYRMLAEAVEADLSYDIKCPALLICGTKDRAGYCLRYNREWHKRSGIPIEWIEGAGHNSNTDKPETVNRLIEDFAAGIESSLISPDK